MPSRDAPDFPAFFEEVTGRQPFEWQAVLTEELVSGRIPTVIDVPTGFGKTSVILCWAYALGVTSAEKALPRRLAFVVDRRLIVDAAHEEAQRLASELGNPGRQPGVRVVARGLDALHGGDAGAPLSVVRMRGGLTWESRWLARPDQAAVIIGTVDQFGSRLLFRGYGVSDGMRPINAALVGTDSWLVIDEAHIAEALVATATSVSAYQQLAESSNGAAVARPLCVTKMSATVDDQAGVFRADLDRQGRSRRFSKSAEAARRRLAAVKPAKLVDLPSLATGSTNRRREISQQMGRELAELALAVDPEARVIGVIANTIATARAAHDRIASSGHEACLLIGRCREYERDQVLVDYESRLRVGVERRVDNPRLYVVATQTIEVGADFDLDAVITECAPLPSLVQRFGRVNRVGARQPCESSIVHSAFMHGEDDLVYGKATAATWDYLQRVSVGGRERLDFGIFSTRQFMHSVPDAAKADPPFVPRLLGAHLERWAATGPAPFPDQDVGPFLHGVDRSIPEVSVAWRLSPPAPGGATPDQQIKGWQWWLGLVRPVEWEFVSVPIWEARALITGEPSVLPTSDLEGALSPEIPNTTTNHAIEIIGVVLRRPAEEPKPIRSASDIAPGDRIVFDSRIGGHDRWGWTGRRARDDETVPDVADLAPSRSARCLRIDAGGRVLASLIRDPQSAAQVRETVTAFVAAMVEARASDEHLSPIDPEDVRALLLELDSDVLPLPMLDRIQTATAEQWVPRLTRFGDDGGAGDAVLLLVENLARVTPFDAISDDDEGATSSAARAQGLAEHSADVHALASKLTRFLGIPDSAARAVVLAAQWHDIGKADDRFQTMLYDGDALAARIGIPRAKSGRDWRDPIARQASQIAGVPRGFRHEAVSARLVRALLEAHPGLAQGIDTELLYHLIVSHHGHARPLLPAISDTTAPSVTIPDLEGDGGTPEVTVTGDPCQVDWTHPSRFGSLNARYGWWGLAYLETLVRLADLECSARIIDSEVGS